jgi:hypothetical protein
MFPKSTTKKKKCNHYCKRLGQDIGRLVTIRLHSSYAGNARTVEIRGGWHHCVIDRLVNNQANQSGYARLDWLDVYRGSDWLGELDRLQALRLIDEIDEIDGPSVKREAVQVGDIGCIVTISGVDYRYRRQYRCRYRRPMYSSCTTPPSRCQL